MKKLLYITILFAGLFLAKYALAANVYYSVGQNSDDHKTGSPTMTISSGLATFSESQTATNLGVGDRVSYNGTGVSTSSVFISGKVSTSQWNVVTVLGAAPTDIAVATTVDSIAHEFTSLSAAEAASSDAGHLGTLNLTTGHYILNFPCYYDSGGDPVAVTINGYTTNIAYYINIYTPIDTSTECNQKQRHAGIANGTGYYKLVIPASNTGLIILDNYTRVTGIAFDGNSANVNSGLNISYNGGDWARVSDCLFYDIYFNSIVASDYAPAYIWNNILTPNNPSSSTFLFRVTVGAVSGDEVYFENNTVYGADSYGISLSASANGRLRAKNNIVYNSGTADFHDEGAGGWNDSDYNFSKDNSAPGANSIHGTTDGKTPDFISTTAGSENLHLQSTSDAIDAGVDLSLGSIQFSDDIDGEIRPSSEWDIGADEYVGEAPPGGGEENGASAPIIINRDVIFNKNVIVK